MTHETPETMLAGTSTVLAAGLPLYLPVPGGSPWPKPRPVGEPLHVISSHLAARLSLLAGDLASADTPTPAYVQCELRLLADLAAACIQRARGTIAALASSYSRQTSDRVMIEVLAPVLPWPTIERYLAYDRYFNVLRIGHMTDEEMLAQVLVISERLLADLPYTFLARDELESLLMGLSIMISGDGAVMEGHRQPPETTPPSQITDCRDQDQLYRWIVGHHVFMLVTGYCRCALDTGLERTLDDDVCAQQIGIAGSLLRASTAAMWYASDMGPEVYMNHVRPSMPAGGFSGEHNSDHVLLRSSKDRLVRAATAIAKGHDCSWGHGALSNTERFLEIDIEDSEAHVLLAASKVGRQASLAQDAAAGEQARPQTTAVDMLRAIGKHKQSVSAAFFRSQLKKSGNPHPGGGNANVE